MSDVTIPGGKIRSFVERIENIDGELAELNDIGTTISVGMTR